MKRSPFNQVFWIGNIIEIFERFAYYGLYMGFGIYATKTLADGGLGWDKAQLGTIQAVFLFLSYSIPLVSGILADQFGFKKMLIISYILYLPGFIFLIFTKQFTLVFLTMSLIAIAAGVFKPLIAGTVRLTTDKTNQTLGFGIFYLMVNIGAFFGPMLAGALRTISWNYAFMASAVAVVVMFFITLFSYKDPSHEVRVKDQSFFKNIKEIFHYLKDPKILIFIFIFGIFIEIPFWSFFNLVTMYVDTHVNTKALYDSFYSFFQMIGIPDLGRSLLDLFSTDDHRIAGETIGHTALYIIVFQMLVTRVSEKSRAMPTVAAGIVIMLLGCVGLYASVGDYPGLMFLGILLFAVGEMTCIPRFEQYLISLLPREKTGLGGGLLRIPIAIGALSGITITPLYGHYENSHIPQVTWLVLGGILLIGFLLVLIYDRFYKSE